MPYWIPSGHYDPGIGYMKVQRRYLEDSKKGVFDEYHKRSIKKTYFEE